MVGLQVVLLIYLLEHLVAMVVHRQRVLYQELGHPLVDLSQLAYMPRLGGESSKSGKIRSSELKHAFKHVVQASSSHGPATR